MNNGKSSRDVRSAPANNDIDIAVSDFVIFATFCNKLLLKYTGSFIVLEFFLELESSTHL